MMGKDKETIRVAVIGGGASGWSAVRALEEAATPETKFETTILEKDNRWGGKCCTVVPDGNPSSRKNGEELQPDPNNPNQRKYEMGAGVLSGTFSKPTENYANILRYVEELGFDISLVERMDRQNYVFLKDGKEVNPTSAGLILQNIRHFLKAKYDIWRNYTSNILEYKDILAKYPFLAQHLSHRYPNQAVLEAMAKAGQGYGYADLDDPYLAPPMVYFLDYIKSEVEKSPLHSVDQGMQEIWSKTAEIYKHKVNQRLGETVTDIDRDNLKLIVKTDKDSSGARFDKLVVAAPLIHAQKFMDYSEQEQSFLNKIKYNYYVTVLCKVDMQKDAVGWSNVTNTVDRSRLGQVVFGYRPYPDSPWMTIYLYMPKGTTLSDEKILNQVEKSLKEDMNARLVDKESAIIRHWEDYFAHLDKKELENGWYNAFDKNFQNKKNTLYVGTPLHMEIVGNSVKYAYNVTKKAAQQWINERTGNVGRNG